MRSVSFALAILVLPISHVVADSIDLDSMVSSERLAELVKKVEGTYKEPIFEPTMSSASTNDLLKYQSSDFWYVSCRKDVFNGDRHCSMFKGDLFVSILNGKYYVNIGTDHFPQSSSGLKVDNNSAVYGYEGSIKESSSIIEQLKNGKVAHTRFVKWPYRYNRDGKVNLVDFGVKFKEMQEKYTSL